MQRECRAFGQVEARAAADDIRRIVGYAAVFNSPTEIGSYFVERIAPGAFADAVKSDDVRALFNHDDNLVLGRTKAGTLKLAEDERGLKVEILPPDTSWARDLVVSIERGDVSQMSFAFRARREEWDETGPVPVRTLLDVELLDVSAVTYPAYDDTEVGVRAEALLSEARSAGLITRSAIVPPRPDPRLRMRAEIDLRARGAI